MPSSDATKLAAQRDRVGRCLPASNEDATRPNAEGAPSRTPWAVDKHQVASTHATFSGGTLERLPQFAKAGSPFPRSGKSKK